jgi:hypothetical protein
MTSRGFIRLASSAAPEMLAAVSIRRRVAPLS